MDVQVGQLHAQPLIPPFPVPRLPSYEGEKGINFGLGLENTSPQPL